MCYEACNFGLPEQVLLLMLFEVLETRFCEFDGLVLGGMQFGGDGEGAFLRD